MIRLRSKLKIAIALGMKSMSGGGEKIRGDGKFEGVKEHNEIRQRIKTILGT